MNDGKNDETIFLYLIDHPVLKHDGLTYRGIVHFWRKHSQMWKVFKLVYCFLHFRDYLSGACRRVLCDVLSNRLKTFNCILGPNYLSSHLFRR